MPSVPPQWVLISFITFFFSNQNLVITLVRATIWLMIISGPWLVTWWYGGMPIFLLLYHQRRQNQHFYESCDVNSMDHRLWKHHRLHPFMNNLIIVIFWKPDAKGGDAARGAEILSYIKNWPQAKLLVCPFLASATFKEHLCTPKIEP